MAPAASRVRSLRFIPVGVALALVVGALYGSPVDARAKKRIPELRGTTVVSGNKTAALTVRLPKKVSISGQFFSNPDVDIEGGGRVTGVVLVQQGTSDPAEIWALRSSWCNRPGCEARSISYVVAKGDHYGFGSDPVAQRTLPKGKYWLFLITDGARVKVTLDLDGIGGTTKLPAPENKVRARAGSLTTRVSDTVGRTFISAGDIHTATRPGVSMVTIWVEAEDTMQTSGSTCFSRSNPESEAPPQEADFLPGCPGGGSNRNISSYSQNGPADLATALIGLTPIEPGSFKHGGWYQTTAKIKKSGASGLWLEYPLAERGLPARGYWQLMFNEH